MTNGTKLKAITEIVKEVLTQYPEARNSDDILYFLVCKKIDAISLNRPFKDIILNRKDYNYPALTYVARAGRKVREHHPELSGDGNVEGHRKENEKAFEEYSKTVI